MASGSSPEIRGHTPGEEGLGSGQPKLEWQFEAAESLVDQSSASKLADLGPTAVDASMTLGEVAFATLRMHFGAFLAREHGARLGENPEEVHDMRVASRRLRAAIKFFHDALPPQTAWLRREAGWIASSLGEVRDLDVQLAQIDEWTKEMTAEGGPGLAPLVNALERDRRRVRHDLIRDFDSPRFERLLTVTTETLRRGPPDDIQAARIPVVTVAPDLVRTRYRRVRKIGDRIDASSPPPEYHLLRIRAKRLRYALEFLSPIYGRPARAFIKSLVAAQDVLGMHQDARVAVERIGKVVRGGIRDSSPETWFLLGRIVERYESQAAECRRRFPSVYRNLRGKRWKSLRAAMEV